MEIPAESFNVTNTPQFANPNVSFTSANFGVITATRATGSGVSGTAGGACYNSARGLHSSA